MNSHYMKYVILVISRRFGWKCVEKETMKGQMKNLLGVEMLFHQDWAQMFIDALSWLRLLKRNHGSTTPIRVFAMIFNGGG